MGIGGSSRRSPSTRPPSSLRHVQHGGAAKPDVDALDVIAPEPGRWRLCRPSEELDKKSWNKTGRIAIRSASPMNKECPQCLASGPGLKQAVTSVMAPLRGGNHAGRLDDISQGSRLSHGLTTRQLRQVVYLLRATWRRRCFRSSIEEAMRWRCEIWTVSVAELRQFLCKGAGEGAFTPPTTAMHGKLWNCYQAQLEWDAILGRPASRGMRRPQL